jgi:hypothetical protein
MSFLESWGSLVVGQLTNPKSKERIVPAERQDTNAALLRIDTNGHWFIIGEDRV